MWTVEVKPRFGDIDGLRHVNNCTLPKWFELGQEPMFRLFHPDLNLERWRLIIVKTAVDYLNQLRLGQPVEIRTFVKKIGRSSFTLLQEAWQDGALGARGETVLVHYDYDNAKSLALPEPIVREFEKHPPPPANPRVG